MKKCFVNRNRAIMTNHQSTEVVEPGESEQVFHGSSFVKQTLELKLE
jgi:hypothetical protein